MAEKENTELEKLEEIYIAIVKRNGEINDINSRLKEIAKLGESFDRLHRIIIGDGTDTNIGLVNRMRVIEKWIDAKVWFERVLTGALIGEAVAIIVLLAKLALRVE